MVNIIAVQKTVDDDIVKDYSVKEFFYDTSFKDYYTGFKGFRKNNYIANFDFSSLYSNSMSLIVGPSGVGKSYYTTLKMTKNRDIKI